MAETANLALPLIAAAQAQKHVTHNEALLAIDALLQCAVLDKDLAVPPAGPAEGDRYIAAAGASGDWDGQAGRIAMWHDGAWDFYDPRPGFVTFVIDEALIYVFAGTAWTPITSALSVIQNLGLLGVGTTADAVNPFSAKLNKALWTARTIAEGGDGDLRYTLNKENPADVLSLLFQTGFSGRAELGLIGDDNLTVKVSPDGTGFITALAVDRSTGLITHADGVIPRTVSVQNSGSTNDASVGSGTDVVHTPVCVLPGNFLKQGRALRIVAHFRLSTGSAPPNLNVRLKAGATTLANLGPVTPAAGQTNNQFCIVWYLQAIDPPGPAANVEAADHGNTNAFASATIVSDTDMPVALPTNATLTLQVATQWSGAGSGPNTVRLSQLLVESLN